jgi:LysM repeat protein
MTPPPGTFRRPVITPPNEHRTTPLSRPLQVEPTSRIVLSSGLWHGPGEDPEGPEAPQVGSRMARYHAGRQGEDDRAGGGLPRRWPATYLMVAASVVIVALGGTAALALTGQGPFGDGGGPRVEFSQAPPASESGVADRYALSVMPEVPTASAPEASTEAAVETESEAQAEEEPAGPQTHTVGTGETLESIAARHGIPWRLLYDANPDVERPDLLFEGQVLVIPPADADLPRRELPKPPEPEPKEQEAPARQSNDTSRERPSEPEPPTVPDGSVWDQLAQCESGGNWSINTGNGYYGGLQFSLSSWQAVGGTGYPHEHSREEQIRRGEMLQARQGWGAWPSCARKLGLT